MICVLVKIFNWELCRSHKVYVSKYSGKVFVVLGFGVYRSDSSLTLYLRRANMVRTCFTPNEIHKQYSRFEAMYLLP